MRLLLSLLLAMAFRSISTNNAPATSLVVTAPAGIVDGDILVAWSVSDASGNNQLFPAGFVAVTGSPQDLSVFDASQFAVAIKVASGESGNYTLTGTAAIIGGVACFSGRTSSTTPHKVSATKADSSHASPYTITSAAFGSATTLTSDIIYIAESDGATNDITHTAPSGYTFDADICQTANFERQFVFAHKDGVASGETGTLSSTGTGSAAAWAAFAIALADGAPVVPPPPLARIMAPQQRMLA